MVHTTLAEGQAIRVNNALPRSYLFVPGDRPERFIKAANAGSDCVILDLEDAVLPDEKGNARAHVRDWLSQGNRAAVRINGIGTPWHEADMALVCEPGLESIILPKTEAGAALDELAADLAAVVPLIPIVESASGLLDVRMIAATRGVQRLAFGSVDYCNDLGVSAEDDNVLAYPRMAIIVASAAAGIAQPVDGVTLALADDARLAADVALVRRLGMGAKLCIHPRQIPAVNDGFNPSATEIAEARKIVEAAETAGAKGAIRIDNKMIDRPVVERSRRILSLTGEGRA